MRRCRVRHRIRGGLVNSVRSFGRPGGSSVHRDIVVGKADPTDDTDHDTTDSTITATRDSSKYTRLRGMQTNTKKQPPQRRVA